MMRARGDDKEKSKDEFDEFTAIVNEYVQDKSNSEVNIDSGTKKKILGVCDRSTYSSLDLVRERRELQSQNVASPPNGADHSHCTRGSESRLCSGCFGLVIEGRKP